MRFINDKSHSGRHNIYDAMFRIAAVFAVKGPFNILITFKFKIRRFYKQIFIAGIFATHKINKNILKFDKISRTFKNEHFKQSVIQIYIFKLFCFMQSRNGGCV